MENNKLNTLGAFEYLELFDKDGNRVYSFVVHLDGSWSKGTYDSNGNKLTSENSVGGWSKFTYDLNGNGLTYENSDGNWNKSTYDSDGKELTYENWARI
jgi:hypothetical protein